MANCCFLELGTLDCDHNIVASSFENLDEDNHLFVFHKVKTASAKVKGVRCNNSLNFVTKLTHHSLIKMPIRPFVIGVGLCRIDCGPTTQGLWISYDEECKAEEGDRGSV